MIVTQRPGPDIAATDPSRQRADHLPVLRDAVAHGLALADGGVYVDCTFGRGGYTRFWLERAGCTVCAIDRDPAAIRAANEMAADYAGRLIVLQGCFGDMAELLDDAGIGQVDGIAMDLGVSSPQLDEAERGFSFQADGPLDMRMGDDGPTAADIVNEWPVERLTAILRTYGEERQAGRIARAIARVRAETPIRRTGQLAELIARTAPGKPGRIHPATRSFQAIRIAVNDELGELRRGLVAAENRLRPGGRLAVVSFHSLEDRMVKRFLAVRAGATPRGSRHRPETGAPQAPSFQLIRRGVETADTAETDTNPRARSAKLRVAERLDAAAFDADAGFEDLAA